MSIATALLFLAGMFALVAGGTLPQGIFILYVAASLIAAVAYRVDKSAAQGHRWRTAERTLHLLALVGGWPGALIAQGVFRHKSRKRSFQAVFIATVALNCAALLGFWWAQRPP